MNGILVSRLKKSYGNQTNQIVALAGASFAVREGEFTVILGPSGSGKSTLLNVLGGMDRADSGIVNVFGNRITSYSARQLVEYRRKEIGFVFQFYNLMPNLTALENVAIARCAGSMSEAEALKQVGLTARRNNFPSQLSGGEQQRVAIARAIVKKPRLLLCDEPTGALDSKTGQMILSLLQSLKAQYGTTVLVVTHNAKLADAADRVVRISDGTVVSNAVNAHPVQAGKIEW